MDADKDKDKNKDTNPPQFTVFGDRSHSLEYPLNNIPLHIQLLSTVEPTRLSIPEYNELRKLYENDLEGFLFYEPVDDKILRIAC